MSASSPLDEWRFLIGTWKGKAEARALVLVQGGYMRCIISNNSWANRQWVRSSWNWTWKTQTKSETKKRLESPISK